MDKGSMKQHSPLQVFQSNQRGRGGEKLDSNDKLLSTSVRLNQRDSMSDQNNNSGEHRPVGNIDSKQHTFSFKYEEPATTGGQLGLKASQVTTPDPEKRETALFLREDVEITSIQITELKNQFSLPRASQKLDAPQTAEKMHTHREQARDKLLGF